MYTNVPLGKTRGQRLCFWRIHNPPPKLRIPLKPKRPKDSYPELTKQVQILNSRVFQVHSSFAPPNSRKNPFLTFPFPKSQNPKPQNPNPNHSLSFISQSSSSFSCDRQRLQLRYVTSPLVFYMCYYYYFFNFFLDRFRWVMHESHFNAGEEGKKSIMIS